MTNFGYQKHKIEAMVGPSEDTQALGIAQAIEDAAVADGKAVDAQDTADQAVQDASDAMTTAQGCVERDVLGSMISASVTWADFQAAYDDWLNPLV